MVSCFVGQASAGGLDACDLHSDYSLRISEQALEFERSDGTPAALAISRGRLKVDGRDVAVSAADRDRLRQIESEVRALVPEVRAIALDAIGIAGEAMQQVAAVFGGSSAEAAMARMQQHSEQMRKRIELSDSSQAWEDGEFERAIEAMVEEVVPMMVGSITATAVQLALSGDVDAAAALEAKAGRMEQVIEQSVERRASTLEARADALCPRLHRLEALDASLELRLQDGSELDLLQRDS